MSAEERPGIGDNSASETTGNEGAVYVGLHLRRIVRHGVLETGMAFLQKPITPGTSPERCVRFGQQRAQRAAARPAEGGLMTVEEEGHGGRGGRDDVPSQGSCSRARESGYQVTTALDGTASSTSPGGFRVQRYLSDIDMPGMDGIKLLESVRERDLDVPVVFITGKHPLESAAKAMEYGGASLPRKKPVALRSSPRWQATRSAAQNRQGKARRSESGRRLGAPGRRPRRPRGAIRKRPRVAVSAYQPIVIVRNAACSDTKRCFARASRRCPTRGFH